MTDASDLSALPAQIEIAMLGGLRVRRADGSTVGEREWRTGKTADLLRLLALRHGRPAGPEALMDTLWPNTDPRRAGASLRTATSQIRRVIGGTVVQRSGAGLSLRDVRVDVVEYRARLAQIRVMIDLGMYDVAGPLVAEADALYRGEFSAADGTAQWALAERRALATDQQSLLADGAEAAVRRGRFREAVSFARRAVDADPFDERATRALMHAHMHLAEPSFALRVYEHCRRTLSAELGVDPAAETTAVYLAALRGERGVLVAV